MTLLLEWLPREGHFIFAWWLWMTLAGFAAFPLCLRLLWRLPDRGYTLARALGLLLSTFVFWLLGSAGLLDNSAGGIALSWLLLLAFALSQYGRRDIAADFARWWRDNRVIVLAAESLFILLFVGWALFRAYQNDIVGTEKPMELAFFSAAQRSASFPPADPWMSDYAISYYYMGYVMWSALATLSGISSAVGFNLTVASLFALSGLTAFGLACNLVRSQSGGRFGGAEGAGSRRTGIVTGCIAMGLIALVGNFQSIIVEAPYQSRTAAPSYLDFWGTQARSHFAEGAYKRDPAAVLTLHSASWDYWWWFRASRVITDYDLTGAPIGTQPISEFPAFSFILGDNHPHVLALPFVLMTLGLMLNLLLARRAPSSADMLLYGVAVGGLTFLNAWDGPIYLIGFVGAEALRRLVASEGGKLDRSDWLALLRFGAALALIALIAYLPYFIGFRSQAGGLLPNLVHPTRFSQFFIMYGPLLALLVPFLLVEVWRGWLVRRLNWAFALQAGGILALALAAFMISLGAAIAINDPSLSMLGATSTAPAEPGELPRQLLQRRIDNGLTTIVLLLGVVVVLARLFPSQRQARADADVAIVWVKYPPTTGFVLLLTGMGLVLTLFPEFLYLKDNFGVRINTVFKFYYQAWVLWSIAGAFAVYSVIADSRSPRPHLLSRLGLLLLFALAVGAGLSYSVEAITHRSRIETGRHGARLYRPPADWENPIRRVGESQLVERGSALFSKGSLAEAAESDILRADRAGIVRFRNGALTIEEPLGLDGSRGLVNADDEAVIGCLRQLVGRAEVVVAEAVGDPYRIEYGRVGTLAGIPIVLGWENHERQWRGQTYGAIAGSRREDLRRLYTAAEMSAVEAIIARYGIDYILYGASEGQKYGALGEEKFLDRLPVVCQSGQSRIYSTGRD